MMRVIRRFFPGHIIYTPAQEDGAHPGDAVLIGWAKQRIVVVDAKAKPARGFYPDTGISFRSYLAYIGLGRRHRALVFLCFIDEDAGLTYGNMLHILDKPRRIFWNGASLQYPINHGGGTGMVRYFPLDYMLIGAKLEPKEIEELRSLSTRGEWPTNHRAYGRLGSGLGTGFLPAQAELNLP